MVGSPIRTRRSGARLIVASLLLADIVYGFQQSAIAPALPQVKSTFGASQEWTTWVFSGYLIVASVIPIFGGKLADRIGRRRVFLSALVTFLAGSVTAGLAPSIHVVVIGRLIQGAGGIVFPLSFSILRDHVDQRWVSRGIGILTGGFGFGGLAGFAVGGALAEFAGWRWIFGIGVIALTIGIIMVRLVIPESPTRDTGGLDTVGALLLGLIIAALIIAVTEGPRRGWLSAMVISCVVLAIAASVIWVWHERRTAYPLMDLQVLTSRVVAFTHIASFCSGYAVFSINIVVPFVIQDPATPHAILGLTGGAFLTGLVLVPRALGQTIAGPLSGPIAQRITARWLMAVGLGIQTISAIALALWHGHVWAMAVSLAGLGIGFGTTVSTAGSIVTLSAPSGQTGTASALNSVMRRFGGGIGAQAATVALAEMTTTVSGQSVPAQSSFSLAFVMAAIASAVAAGFAVLAARKR